MSACYANILGPFPPQLLSFLLFQRLQLYILPQPEAVIDRRVVHKGQYCPKTEILVKWAGAPLEDATWEDVR